MMATRLADASVSTIGCGIMGGLLIERLLAAGAVSPAQLFATDTNAERLEEVRGRLGIGVSTNNRDGAGADVLLIAVPPPAIVPVIEEIGDALGAGQLVVSLAPAISLERLGRAAGAAQVARVMPNTPSLVGAGMNAYCLAEDVTADQAGLLREMLDVWGESVEVPQDAMSAACALLAVGPTYLLPVLGTLVEAATEAGMAPQTARRIAAGLFAGVGQLVAQSEATPEQLKQMISMQPLDDAAAAAVFSAAYDKALAGLRGLESKLMG